MPIAPVSLDGTIPFGFISHVQSRKIGNGGVTRQLLVEPLAGRMPRTILPGLIRIASKAHDFRTAEALIVPLVPHFPIFIPAEAQALAEAAVENGQIWSAALCKREYLPEFVDRQRNSIKPNTLRALEYQIANNKWYNENE